jgi:hypothetical protein
VTVLKENSLFYFFKPERRITEMRKRYCINIIRCLLLLGMLLFFMGGTIMAATQTNKSSKTKESSMDIAYKTESHAIPPIDATVSPIFQTASFGLG